MESTSTRSSVLKNRRFLLLWSAQAISQTAQNAVTITLVIEVGHLSSFSVQHSLIVLAFIVPAVLLGPIAGVFVDHAEKRFVLTSANFLRAVVVIGYALIKPDWPTGTILLFMYVLSIVFSTISQFFSQAEASTIPQLVGPDQLLVANSFFELTLIASQVIGFSMLGPLLIKLTSPTVLYLFVASLYLVCTALVWLLPPLPASIKEASSGGLRSELVTALREIREIVDFLISRGSVTAAIVDLSTVTAIFLMLGTLGVGLVASVLHLPSNDLAFLMASGGLGLVATLFLVSRIGDRYPRGTLIDVGLAGIGVGIVGMAVTNDLIGLLFGGMSPGSRSLLALPVIVALAVLIGAGSALVTVPAQTVLQEDTPVEMRGRVFASLFTVSSALSVLPVLLTGVLADILGLQWVMGMIGLLTLGLAGLGRLTSHGDADPARMKEARAQDADGQAGANLDEGPR